MMKAKRKEEKEKTKNTQPIVQVKPNGQKQIVAPPPGTCVEPNGFSLELQPFDHSTIHLDSFVLVLGKRRYGKTTWAQYMVGKIWKYFPDGAYVFTQTKHNYSWQAHVPHTRVYNGFPPEVVTKIIEEQQAKYERILLGEKGICPFVLIVLDDIIAGGELHRNIDKQKEALWEQLVFGGRHIFIFVILCSQDPKGVSPKVRSNADYIAVTYQTQKRAVDSILEDYATLFEPKELFQQFLQENTKEHSMLIIDQATAKYSIEEMFFCDKAPDPAKHPPMYRLGDKQFWKESGCSWHKQLELVKNKKEGMYDRESIEPHIAKRWEKDEDEPSSDDEIEEQVISNNIFFAPKDFQKAVEPKKPDSYRKQALDLIDNGRGVRFIPGPLSFSYSH